MLRLFQIRILYTLKVCGFWRIGIFSLPHIYFPIRNVHYLAYTFESTCSLHCEYVCYARVCRQYYSSILA